ncbi:centrosomal protein of 70 kDa [Seriola aureovittata]|uniref:centrosomal protein of 70 kDa n=1 Tax=Seriola aureovittata TaxID=2871759 RepID=UPI0024BE1D07|nr:centrosomal protein of 70 kDa [Seriola aureovittata]
MGPSLRSRITFCLAITLAQVIAVTCQEDTKKDSRAPPTQVVNQVAQLVSSGGHAARLYDLLGDVDIDSIIVKARQHDEFFPPFRALVTDILQILGLRRLDDILPALKSLKQTAQ